MEKSIEQQRKEFLEETVQFYSEDVTRRATDGYHCMYRTEDGRKCAIGRHISDDKYTSRMEENSCVSNIVFYSLPQEIQDLGQDFLSHIQSLHDGDENWGKEKGLSPIGEGKVNYIRKHFIKI